MGSISKKEITEVKEQISSFYQKHKENICKTGMILCCTLIGTLIGLIICNKITSCVVCEKAKITIDNHKSVQLWENGPYWAETNIGAENPDDYGYYFWWGDTIGYKRENDKWVASDGSSSNFSFEESNAPTYGKSKSTLQSEDWTTSNDVLAPEHDAARAHWGSNWRMPTASELQALIDNCTWTSWTTTNGVNGCKVSGKGAYSGASIFLPIAGIGRGTSFDLAGLRGFSWSSSVLVSDDYSWNLRFGSGYRFMFYYDRDDGLPVRPVSEVH